MNPRRSFGLLAALAITACAAPGRDAGAPRASLAAPKVAASALMLSPARYLYTDRTGVMFDEAGPPATLPRPEPAIIEGLRLMVDHGMVLAHASSADRLTGFRSIPARLGGGYVIWSGSRLYRAETFLGDLKPIADVSVRAGARPYLRSIVLRTDVGLLSLDPTSLALTRDPTPGLAELMALDARRAVRIDALGRASFTVDGGATFTDLFEKRGVHITSIREGPLDELLLSGLTPAANLRLGKEGTLDKPRDLAPNAGAGETRTSAPLLSAFPSSSRALAADIVAQAIVAGALIPKAEEPAARTPPDPTAPPPSQGSILVARENGLRLLSASTALPIGDADLLNVDEKFGRCQAFSLLDAAQGSSSARERATRSPPLALCAQDEGGEVLAMSSALSRPKLEITFPEAGSYVAGPHGRLGFTGRCGPQPPSARDLGPGTPHAPETPEEDPSGLAGAQALPPPEPGLPDLPPDDDARFCVRLGEDHWIERRVRGEDARHLYRWIPGDDGKVTALLLGREGEETRGAGDAPPGSDDASPPEEREDAAPARKKKPEDSPRVKAPLVIGEGVRVIRLDPDDPALKGGAFPAVPAAQKEAPYLSLDENYWQADDGSIRGWAHLPADGDTAKVEATAQGPAKRLLRVHTPRGGRATGIRIDPQGRLTALPLPEATTDVVYGGRFGLAMAVKDDTPAYFETTDGGATWTPVEGPPVGRIEPPPDESAPFGCSRLGCTWGAGIVRLGWGGPPPPPRPSAAEEKAPPLAENPLLQSLKPLKLTCRVDADAAVWETDPTRPPAKAPPAPPKPKGAGLAPASPSAALPLAGGAPGARGLPPPRPGRPSPRSGRPPPPRPGARPLKPGGPPPAPRGPGGPLSAPRAPPPAPSSRTPRTSPASPEAPQESPLAASPALPISLGLRGASTVGSLAGGTWTGDVWLPFQPEAPPKHLSVTDGSLTSSAGSVVPILGSSPRSPVDLLVVLEKHRLRVGAPGRLFSRFDVQRSVLDAAADTSDGLLLALDADSGSLWLTRGDAVTIALGLVRVSDASRVRLTLARRLDGRGFSVIGYSTSTGEVFSGDIDLARANVGPLVALGRLDTIAEAGSGACQGLTATHRFLAEVPSVLTILGKKGLSLFDAQVSGTLLLEGNGERLCAAGFEVGLKRGSAADLTASFGKSPAAAVRSAGRVARGSCSLSSSR